MPRNIHQIIDKQIRQSEHTARHNEEKGFQVPRPVVTISRTMGSGARIIARKLASDLGWSLWDKELLDAMAENAQVSRKVVEAFDEKDRSEIDLLVHDLIGDHELSSFMYAKHLIKAVASIARIGNSVILGRGANLILPNALNIRIDAPLELRVKNMMTYENLSLDEAIKKLKKSDQERARFLKKTFYRDIKGHPPYNMELCMCSFTNEEAVELIKLAIKFKFRLNI